jgi:hypothetical protein
MATVKTKGPAAHRGTPKNAAQLVIKHTLSLVINSG